MLLTYQSMTLQEASSVKLPAVLSTYSFCHSQVRPSLISEIVGPNSFHIQFCCVLNKKKNRSLASSPPHCSGALSEKSSQKLLEVKLGRASQWGHSNDNRTPMLTFNRYSG